MDEDAQALNAGDRRHLLAWLAGAALAAGVLVYLLDRPSGSAYFLPPGWSFFTSTHGIFGGLGGVLPDSAHVYAFSLLTAVALGAAPRTVTASSFLWWAIDMLFELGQHPAISPHVVAATPGWFNGIPFLENTAAYFARGTFDPADLVAVSLGAFAAWMTLVCLRQRQEGRRHV